MQEGGKEGEEGVRSDLQRGKVGQGKLQRLKWSEQPTCRTLSFLLLSGKKETFQRGRNMSEKSQRQPGHSYTALAFTSLQG